MRNKAGSVFVVLGLLLLLGAFGLTVYNMWDEGRADSVVSETVQLLRAKTPDLELLDPEGELIPNYILDPEREMPIIQIDGNDYVGYIEVPVLELSLPVMESWSYPNLKISACRYTGSVYHDDMVIAAHNYQRHFGALKNILVGDEVRFTDGDGNVFIFEVSTIEQLYPTQVQEMTETEWDLTLFTCTLSGQQRLTIRCTRVADEPAFG